MSGFLIARITQNHAFLIESVQITLLSFVAGHRRRLDWANGSELFQTAEASGLRVCSINRDLRTMQYETQTLSERLNGQAVGAAATVTAPAAPPRPAAQDRPARGRQR